MSARPRLLAVNNYFYRRGGAESVFLDHIDLFAGHGWDVAPFAMRHPDNLPSAWSDHFVNEIEFGRQPNALIKAAHAMKIIYSLEAKRKIKRMIGLWKPTVAHAHNVYHHLSPSIFTAIKEAGVPLVMTAHDLKVACPAYQMLSRGTVCERCRGGHVQNVVLRRCVKGSLALSGLILLETLVHRGLSLYRGTLDRLVVPSRFYHDKLAAWGWDAGHLAYIPNSIDTAQFAPSTEAGHYFVYAGRLAPEKGLETLVRAAALGRHRVVLAGAGPEEARLRALAAALDADIVFAGRLSGAALHRTISEAMALVLPSEWYENAPMSLLESYALGRPVIGADIGGIPEMVQHGETGVLTQPGDPSSLADAMGRVAAMSDRGRARWGAAGRAWVEAEFAPQRYRERTLELYDAIGARA